MPRVIIAEDHDVVREGLSRILQANGHVIVAETGSGLEVLDVLDRVQAEVLLLDLGLEGLHGLDVLRQLARRNTSTRVLVLSAEGRDDFVIGALRSGARGYLLKSCSSQELVEAVNTVARGGHYVATELSDALVRRVGDTSGAEDPYDSLTDREREVFHAMAEGLSNAAIGERLFISARTVESHRAKVMKTLGLKGQTDIVLFALRKGIINLG